MSIARAFTTRKAKFSADLGFGDHSKTPQRSNSSKPLRAQISAPVQLVHTTNMLSYNAPDLPRSGHSRSGSSSPRRSEDDSSTVNTNESTPPTSPDVAPGEPMANHLSTYFIAPRKVSPTVSTEAAAPPSIPQRSPSHTKKASLEPSHSKKASYDMVRRQRSASNMSKNSDLSISTKSSMNFSRSSSTSTNTTTTSHLSSSQSYKIGVPPVPSPLSPLPPQQATSKDHPFGQELAQVTELVEEFGEVKQSKGRDEDDEYIKSRGLTKMTATDYLAEIDYIASTFFPEVAHIRAAGPLWI